MIRYMYATVSTEDKLCVCVCVCVRARTCAHTHLEMMHTCVNLIENFFLRIQSRILLLHFHCPLSTPTPQTKNK